MSGIPCILRFLGAFLLLGGTGTAGVEAGWDERLATEFSGRLQGIEKELASIAPQLQGLPNIPIDDQGGTGGFASMHSSAMPERGTLYAVEISWPKVAQVDMVALVPARRYGARGLDAQYGMPDDFKVELIDAAGAVVALVAHERNASSNPVRHGHPFVYQISPPVVAAGLRITAEKLRLDSEGEGNYVHAWAEAFVFEEERIISHGAEVRSLGGTAPASPWHWKTKYLVDGQTPLGLPEIPDEGHRNVGWLSNGRTAANEAVSLIVDLGKSETVDAVRLLPAKRPTTDLPSGFGFPKKLTIALSETGEPGEVGNWRVASTCEMQNPGHNPVLLPFAPTKGRYVRIEAGELWKVFDEYPAFFALSEVEVLSGAKNLALGRNTLSPDGMLNIMGPDGRYWSNSALNDGYGPEGRLVSTREWLTLLDRRFSLETRRNELQIVAGQLVREWRNTGLAVFVILGLAGAFAIIALPIRYRIHSRRELMKVRERIAGDLHDEVGSNLGSIQMFADLAEGRVGESEDLKRIQRIASETVSAVRDIVWLLRPEGDHRIGAIEHLRETSSIMLETLKWQFHANEASWQVEFPEEANRHLFLFFREALHNILRHAKAQNVDVRVDTSGHCFLLVITDDGVGIEAERLARPATLRALRQRADALGANLHIESETGRGTRLELRVPLGRKHRPKTPPAGEASEQV